MSRGRGDVPGSAESPPLGLVGRSARMSRDRRSSVVLDPVLEAGVKRSADMLATIMAGGAGATIAALAVGAKLLVVLPVMLGVAAVAFATRPRT